MSELLNKIVEERAGFVTRIEKEKQEGRQARSSHLPSVPLARKAIRLWRTNRRRSMEGIPGNAEKVPEIVENYLVLTT